jgi:AraC-like DNA-binding protein
MKNIPIRNIRTIRQEPVFLETFTIRKINGLLNGIDMVQELHRHSFYFILALEKGQGSHIIDFTTYPVSDHSVYFMRPGQVHELVLKSGCTGFLIQFTSEYYFPNDKTSVRLLRKAAKMNYYHPKPTAFLKLAGILNNISEEFTLQQEGYLEVIKASMGIFFIELARQQTDASGANPNPYMQERLEELLSLLETHILEIKQVSEYASMMNLSLYQLNSITRETLGKTCSQLINEHIILEAKRYLLATSNQVNQVADHLGYEDVSYFIRYFKKQTGYSPEAFRSKFK